MEQEEKKESASPLSVLPRLDRLDRLLELFEEMHSLSGRSLSTRVAKIKQDDQCKTLSSALEEVHQKGTLMEQLAMLETRVFAEMYEANPRRSSSSTVPVSQNFGHGSASSSSMDTKQDNHDIVTIQTRQDLINIRQDASVEASVIKSRRHKKKAYKKVDGWFSMGC